MSRRTLAAVAAFLLAAVGATFVVLYARSADQRALAGQEAVRAFVVVETVPAGTTAGAAVENGLMEQQLIARKAVPDTVLTSIDGGYDQLVATSALQPGELVLKPRFAARAAAAGQLGIPEGEFAVTVALDDPSRVGPFVTVGSRVAVFDTFNVQELDTRDTTPAGDRLQERHEFSRATRLVLPELEVLAIGARTTAPEPGDAQDADGAAGLGSDGALAATTLVTFAVTQPEAEKLLHAARTGTISLALIGPESVATPGAGIDDRRLFQVAR
jgi:pilus assembly protein CpaB